MFCSSDCGYQFYFPKSCFHGQTCSDHVWQRNLSYYSLLNHFIVSRLYGGELKHCTFGCDFTKHAQDFGTKLHVVSNKHCDQQCGENTEQQDNSEPWLCGWGSPTPCTGQCPLEKIDQSNWLFIHYFTLQTLIWAHSGINSSRCNRYWREDTQLYAKKYGVLSRPGYLNRCMHSNNMCSPNSVFLSVEENQKRFVIEDKWRLERT